MSEISTILSSPYIFGLGGHPASFSTNKTSNFTIKSLFSSNLIENPQRTSIKSFLGVDDNKNFYGLLLESKTPVEVELLPGIPNKKPFLIFRSMGGIITIHIFSGPKPSDVSEQIANVIGKPKLPPKWILGIHLCRSNGELMKSEAIETNFPYDSDCLDRGVVGSGFKLMYSPEEIAKISILLRIKNKKIIITNPLPIDPKEKVNKKLKLINDQRNKIELIGDYKQFKNVSIPDLLEDTKEWKNALTFLLNSTSHPDALHISDNAPDLKIKNINNEKCDIYFSHKEVISDFGSNLCHLYNYGEHSESKKLHSDVRDIYPSIVLEKSSRSIKNLFSDFASLGIQKHGWILSSEPVPGNPEVDEWTLLQKDLQATIEYGLAGINIRSTCPCTINAKGKIRDEDACYRWFYLGAFMPAINTLKVSPNDFTSGNYKKWIKTAFQNRYKLHPYYYTTLVQGGPLVRPLFYEYPWDERTFSIGLSQVMIGDGLLLAAVTKKIEHDSGIISVYFPRGTWFDFWSGAITHGKDAYEKFICFQFDLPLFLKRGKIIPILESAESDIETTYKKQDFSLIIGLDCDITPSKSKEKSIKNCSADGSLYIEEDKTLLFKAIRTNTVGEVVITPPNPAWTGCETKKSCINSIIMYGLEDQMKFLKLPNGTEITVYSENANAQAYFSKKDKRLQVKNLRIDFCGQTDDLKILWTFIHAA
uniref:Glycoside hydrolase family 31 N-terminal domain-containing protein n=1 Tax=Lepeophtheirus salmonis TaxID=72036 RepID=A0A0K2SXI3_LEPSM